MAFILRISIFVSILVTATVARHGPKGAKGEPGLNGNDGTDGEPGDRKMKFVETIVGSLHLV